MLNHTNKAIIYARVSSPQQVSAGHGLDSQIKACTQFAKENNLEILKVFEDPGYSGKNINRPGVLSLLEFLASHNDYIYVLVDDIDRVMKNKHEFYPFKASVIAAKGILKDLKGTITENDDDPTASFQEYLMVGFADLQRSLNRKRVLERQKQRLLSGYWVFPAPLGFKFDNRELVIDKSVSHQVIKIFEKFANGEFTSYKEIQYCDEAKLLINPKTNSPYKLRDDTVKKMLTNKLYIGKIELKSWDIDEMDANHDAIIDQEIFDKVQLQLRKKGKRKVSKIKNDEFPLKGDLICGCCKSNLVYSKSKGRSKRYPYYRCNSSRELCGVSPKNIPTSSIHKEYLKLLERGAIDSKILKLSEKLLKDIYEDKSIHHKGIQKNKEQRIKSLSKKKDNLINALLESVNRGVIKAIENKINEIDNEINDLSLNNDHIGDLEAFKLSGLEILENPEKAWLEADFSKKKVIHDFIFEKPIEILNGKIGTAEYSLPYRLLRDSKVSKPKMVELGRIELPTSCMPCKRSPS